MKRSLFATFAAAALLTCGTCALLGGCVASYSHTDIEPVSTGEQLSGSISSAQASVPVAGVLEARVAPFNSDNNPMVGDVVSDDPTTAKVLHAVGNGNYAIVGVHQGSTVLRVLADGVVVGTIPIDITPQP